MKPEDIYGGKGVAHTGTLPSPELFKMENVATGDSFSLSVVEMNGQPWFIASDVCDSLGLHRTATRRLDADEKNTVLIEHGNRRGNPNVTIINESGLYSLIFRSRKEAAQRFKKWITSVVIPSIRQNGGYINGQEALSKPEQAATLQVIKQETKRVGLCAVEEQEARSAAFKLMSRSPSYDKHGKRIR